MVLNKKPKKTLMTVLIFIIPFLTGLEVFAYIWCNESDTCFNEGTGAVASPAGIKGSADYIRQYIAEGAGDMLLAYSQTLLFLNRVEMSGPEKTDFAILHTLIENSSVQLEKAKNTWNRLIMAADNTPYNPDVITKLEELDYTNFQMDRSATINKGVFEAVAGFLQKGDTRGVYKKLLMDIEALQRRVNVIKTDLENLRFPELKDLWGLNQTFSNTMLFGQYVAEVFYSIQENR